MAARRNQVMETLNEIKEIIQRHTEADDRNFKELRSLFDGTDANPGLRMRIDRIEQAALAKHSQFKYVWSAIATIAAAAIVKIWIG